MFFLTMSPRHILGQNFSSNVGVSPENGILAAQGSHRDYTHIENILKMNSELVCNRILWCSLKTNKRKKISTKEKKGKRLKRISIQMTK